MNALLIHNDNLPLATRSQFTNSMAFNIPQAKLLNPKFSFDKEADEQLSAQFLNQQYDVIFIPFTLSNQNYLEMTGIRLALHIRLTPKWNHTYTPIIFIGTESVEQIAKLSEFNSFLFTKGIFSTQKFDFISLRKQFDWVLKEWKPENQKPVLTPEEYNRVLLQIQIKPAANYQSHHSIANEWALFRYFSLLEKDPANVNYQNLKFSLEELDYLKSLHFKYKEAIYNRQKINPKKHVYKPKLTLPNNFKIGIVEDESEKGWKDFYKYLIEKEGGTTSFFKFKKGESKELMIGRLEEWILQQMDGEPSVDVFIIDLRLHDHDFSESSPHNMSGVRLTKFIHQKNQGVQTIISTASNKIWNFQALPSVNLESFAIKESPETVNSREETRKSLLYLTRAIQKAVDNSYLAELHRQIDQLKKYNYLKTNQKEEDFQAKVFEQNGILDQIFNLLLLNNENEAVVNQCLLLCFQILEMYCDLGEVGVFDYKAGLGRVNPKLQQPLLEIFSKVKENELLSRLNLEKGKFSWQTEEAFPTIIDFIVSEKPQLKLNSKMGVDASFLIKMISILYFREDIPHEKIKRLIELRYYRSNVAAHYTGRVDLNKFQINPKKDILFFVEIFETIFL